MTDARDLYLGVEIGATKQQLVLTRRAGTPLCMVSEKVPLPNGAVDVRDWLAAQIPPLVARETEFAVGPCGRGGFWRRAGKRTGRVRISVQVPGWQDFPLADWLQECSASRRWWPTTPWPAAMRSVSRGGRRRRHFFYSNIGSGIGGALFLDRVPYDGLGMGAAYFGHTTCRTGPPNRRASRQAGESLLRLVDRAATADARLRAR